MEMLWSLIAVLLIDYAVGTSGPCNSYQNVSDIALRTDNNIVNNNPSCFPSTPVPNWYRFIGTSGGAMATSCPVKSTCGGTGQIWISGSLPTYGDGLSSTPVCIRRGPQCCSQKNVIRSQNCNSFFVFELRKLPSCEIQYCFNATNVKLTTVATTTAGTYAPTSTSVMSTTTATTKSLRLTSVISTSASRIKSTTTLSKTTLNSTYLTKLIAVSTTSSRRASATNPSRATSSKTPSMQSSVSTSSRALVKITLNSNGTTLSKAYMPKDSSNNDRNATLVAVCASIGTTVFLVIIGSVIFLIYRSTFRKTNTKTCCVDEHKTNYNVQNIRFDPQRAYPKQSS